MRLYLQPVFAALTLAATAGAANAATIVNGSFESGSPQPAVGGFSTLGVGSTAITGWKVVGGTIDWINGYWQASDGTHSLDLSGNGPGVIEQTITTVPGQTYRVYFDLSGNPDGGGIAKPGVIAEINGTTQSATFTGIKGISHSQMNWLRNAFIFTAGPNTNTKLRFRSTTPGPFGPALDHVSIVDGVPEPAAWALLIAGFGLAGAALRRRPRVVLA